MKEILKFKDLDVELCLFIEKDNLLYGKYENENISFNISDEQKELIKLVFYKMLPSNNIKDLGYIIYDHNKIRHLYDIENKFHIFNDELEKIDLFNLSYIYNNQNDYVCSLINKKNYMKRGESRYIKRHVKIKDKIFVVFLTSAFLLTMTIGTVKGIQWINYFKDKRNYEQNVLEYENRKLKIEDIINVINNNPNLTNEEKNLFLSSSEFFYDNLEYLDYYTVISNLENLSIDYIPRSGEFSGLSGDFTRIGNKTGKIRIYNATNFADCEKSILTHEFLHAFTKSYNSYNYVYEGIHVIFNNEYYGKDQTLYDKTYQVLTDEMYILCELIDEDVLRKFHADDDINYLIKELVKIIPNYDMALKLIDNINSVYSIKITQNKDQKEYENLKENYNIQLKEIREMLKLYYETKYNISIYDNNYIYFLFNSKDACTKIASELQFDINSFLLADETTSLKQFKKLFNKTGNDNLILRLCDETKEVYNIYTLEEVLSGKTGKLYRNKEEIDLPIDENGNYISVDHEPSHFIDCEVVSVQEKSKNK